MSGAESSVDIDTISADASDSESLRARMSVLYHGNGAPGLIVYLGAARYQMMRPWSLQQADQTLIS
jgi:hypothetical protein